MPSKAVFVFRGPPCICLANSPEITVLDGLVEPPLKRTKNFGTPHNGWKMNISFWGKRPIFQVLLLLFAGRVVD